MPLGTRDFLLVIRAKDQSSRIIADIGRNFSSLSRRIADESSSWKRTSKNFDQQMSLIKRSSGDMTRMQVNGISEVMRSNSIVVSSLNRENAQMKEQLLHTTGQARAGIFEQIAANNVLKAEYGETNARLRDQSATIRHINDVDMRDQLRTMQEMRDGEEALAAQRIASLQAQKALSRQYMLTGATIAGIGAGITFAGLAGIKLFDTAKDVAVEFDQQARHTLTQVGGFKAELEDIKDISRRVADSIAVPFETLQPALYDIFSSIPVDNLRDAETVLKGMAKAAVAGNTEIEAASKSNFLIMNNFGLKAQDLTRILDTQFKLVELGMGTYGEINSTIGNVASTANIAGQSIEGLGGILAFGTRRLNDASAASVSTQRALEAMTNPKVKKNFEAIGIAVTDSMGNFRPFKDVMNDLVGVMDRLSPEKRAALIFELFRTTGSGSKNTRVLIQAITENLGEFNSIMDRVGNSAGSMDAAFNIMSEGPAAKSELLSNKITLLKESIGVHLLPAFTDLIEKGIAIVDWFNSLDKSVKRNIAIFGAAASVIMVVVGILTILLGVAVVLKGVMIAFGVSLGGIAMAAGIFLVAIAAIIAIGYLLIKNWETIKEFAATVWAAILDAVKQPIADMKEWWAENGTAMAADVFKVWNDIKRWTDENWGAISEAVTKFIGSIKDNIQITIDFIMLLWDMWGDNLLRIVKAAWEMIFEVVGNALRAVKNIIMTVVHLINGDWGKAWESFLGIFDAIWDAIFGVLRGAARILGNIIGGILEGIARLFIDLTKRSQEWGKNIIDGLIKGIKNKVQDLKDGVTNVLDGGILQPFKSMFRFGSPSKVTEQYGEWIAQGIEQGLNKHEATLLAASKRLGASAIRGIREFSEDLKDLDAKLDPAAATIDQFSVAVKGILSEFETENIRNIKELLNLTIPGSISHFDAARQSIAELEVEARALSDEWRTQQALLPGLLAQVDQAKAHFDTLTNEVGRVDSAIKTLQTSLRQPLQGTKAFSDKSFAIDQQIKKNRLEIMNLHETMDKDKSLQKMRKALASLIESGADPKEISALEKALKSAEAQMSKKLGIPALEAAIEKLQKKATKVDLERDLKLAPLERKLKDAIDKASGLNREISFDEAMTGAMRLGNLITKQTSLNAQLTTAKTRLDIANEAYKTQKDLVDKVALAYNNVRTRIKNLSTAVDEFVKHAKSKLDEVVKNIELANPQLKIGVDAGSALDYLAGDFTNITQDIMTKAFVIDYTKLPGNAFLTPGFDPARFIEENSKYINQANAAAYGANGVPIFHSGGIMGHTGLALLKRGEGVLNPQATSSLGTGAINRLNTGGGVGGGVTIGPGAIVIHDARDPEAVGRVVDSKLRALILEARVRNT